LTNQIISSRKKPEMGKKITIVGLLENDTTFS
jgi:hypothetical protein